MRTFQPQQYQPRPPFQNQTKLFSYPNKVIDENSIKTFLSRLLSANFGEIKNFFDTNSLPLNSIKDESGNSILHIILGINNNKLSELEKLEICQFLIDKGANINVYNKQGNTPLHIAAQKQYLTIINLFYEKGCNMNSLNNYQQNALHFAVQPIITVCPIYKPLSLIPVPDIKSRDINNISIGIFQQLRDYFKVDTLTNIIDTNTKTLKTIEHYPLLYPLLAIKNIISNSAEYLLTKDDNYLKTNNEILMKQIKDETSKSNLTDKDIQFKVRDIVAQNASKITRELNDYYKNAKENIKFGLDETFNNAKYLPYFVTDNNPTIFDNNGKGIHTHFINVRNKLDENYTNKINNLIEQTVEYLQKIEDLKESVKVIHYFNMFFGKSNTFGYHQKISNETVTEYRNLYKLPINNNKLIIDDERIFFTINNNITLSLEKKQDKKYEYYSNIPQIKKNDISIKLPEILEQNYSNIQLTLSNYNYNDSFNATVIIERPNNTRPIPIIRNMVKNTNIFKDDIKYDKIANEIYNRVFNKEINNSSQLTDRTLLLDKNKIKTNLLEIMKINDLSKVYDGIQNISKFSLFFDLDDIFSDIMSGESKVINKSAQYLLNQFNELLTKNNWVKNKLNNYNGDQANNGNDPFKNLLYYIKHYIRDDVVNSISNFAKNNNSYDNFNRLLFGANIGGNYIASFNNAPENAPNSLGFGAGAGVVIIANSYLGDLNINLHQNGPDNPLINNTCNIMNVIDRILYRSQFSQQNNDQPTTAPVMVRPLNVDNRLPDSVREKLIEIRKVCFNLGYVNALCKMLYDKLHDVNPANNLIKGSVTKTNNMKNYLNDIIDLHKLIKEYVDVTNQHPENIAQNIINKIETVFIYPEYAKNIFNEIRIKSLIFDKLLNHDTSNGINYQKSYEEILNVFQKIYKKELNSTNISSAFESKRSINNKIINNITNITPLQTKLNTDIGQIKTLIENYYSFTPLYDTIQYFKSNLVELNKIKSILRNYQLYDDNYDHLTQICKKAININEAQNNISQLLILLFQWRIKFDFKNNKNIDYANTSVMYNFFDTHRYNEIKELIENLLKKFDFQKTLDISNKYNYYIMYNYLHLLNILTTEYGSYLLFVMKNENINIPNYENLDYDNNIYANKNIIVENINNIKNYDNISDVLNKINTFINDIINILNFHQSMVIQYTFIDKIYSNKYDVNNYVYNYDVFLEQTYINIFSHVGLFNKKMKNLPSIDWKKMKIIDDIFFKQAYPIVIDMIFYTNIKKSDGTNKDIYNGTFLIINNNLPSNTQYIVMKKNGYLLYCPFYKKFDTTDKKIFNGYKIYNPSDSLFYSLSIENLSTMNFVGNRYDLGTYDNLIGIIGINDISNTNPNVPTIDLLNPNQTNNGILPFDLINSYFSAIKDNNLLSYLELITNLKRIFISMVLDTRIEPIYKNPTIIGFPAPIPISDTNLPDKNISTVFGYKNTNKTPPNQSIPNTLFKFVDECLKTTSPDMSERMRIIMANKLIAEGIDTILSKNIDNYYNSVAREIQIYILEYIQPIQPNTGNPLVDKKESKALFPIKTEKTFKFSFIDINDKLFQIMTDKNYYENNIPLVDLDMLTMEDLIDEINIDTFDFKLPLISKSNKDESDKQSIYFKPDYIKNDDAILSNSTLQCIVNNTNMIDRLISLGVYKNHQDMWGKSPFNYAIETKNFNFVNKLLSMGINLNLKDIYRNNTVHKARKDELEHQKILLDINSIVTKLNLCEKYTEILNSTFITNEEFKRNVPKNIELVNYFPIYIINNIWLNIFNDADKETLENLFYDYYNISNKDINNRDKHKIQTKYNIFNNAHIDFNTIINDYKIDENFDFNKILEKIQKIINKYNNMIVGLSPTSAEYNELNKKKDKYIKKYDQLSNKLNNSYIQPPPILPLGPYKYNLLSDLCPNINLSIIDLFNDLRHSNPPNRPELTHYIFSKLMIEYNKFDPCKLGENIHLYMSCIYSRMLQFQPTKKVYTDLKKLETILGKLCTYLDQRYMEDLKIDDNIILKNIVDSVVITTLVTLQNNFVLNLKKILVKHLITEYGFDEFTNDNNNKINQILEKLIVDDKGILNFKTKDVRENLTSEYVKMMFNVKSSSGYDNVEFTKFSNFMEEVKQFLMKNEFLSIPSESTFIGSYNNLVNYYNSLYSTIVDHQKKLITNYIKFILNQYNGIRIITEIYAYALGIK